LGPGDATAALALGLVALLVMPGAGTLAADMDGDGLRDRFETRHGVTDAANPDSDGDGVIDAAEDSDGDRLGNLGEQRFGTHPGHRDSDADGLPDGREDGDRDGVDNAHQQDRRPLPKGLAPTLARAARDIWDDASACAAGPSVTKAKRCRFGDPTAATSRIAVIGDSKAMMSMPAFIAAADQEGWVIETFLKGTCSPLLATINSGAYALDRGRACRAWRRDAIDRLTAEPPDLIVYAHSDDYQLVDERGRVLRGDGRIRAWREGMARTIAALPEASGVLVLGDVPKNASNPMGCLRRHRRDMSACQTARRSLAARPVEVALRGAARSEGAHVGSLQGKVCSYDPCPLVQGDTLMWRDARHLTATFMERLAPSLRTILTEALAEDGP
jgi:hypothetical protein